MKRLATLAVIPLFAGFIFAQDQTSSQTETRTTTTKTTTWNGTLVDAGCRTTHTANRETTTSNPDENTSKTSTTTRTTDSTECPVTESTTSFGLLTSDGKYVRFDDPSNTRVIQVVKNNKHWKEYITEKKPVKVRVIGTPNGDTVVVEKIQ